MPVHFPMIPPCKLIILMKEKMLMLMLMLMVLLSGEVVSTMGEHQHHDHDHDHHHHSHSHSHIHHSSEVNPFGRSLQSTSPLSSTTSSSSSRGLQMSFTPEEVVASSSKEEQVLSYNDGDTIPAAPVQGQAASCSIDLSEQLLGGVKVACMGEGTLERRHCCPVLAAWLMAARLKVALNKDNPLSSSSSPSSPSPSSLSLPLQGSGHMPLLPDDSLVCIASMKAALAARGIVLVPPPANSSSDASSPSPSSSCDVVTCFCGIKLNHITSQSCPLPFTASANAMKLPRHPNSDTMLNIKPSSAMVPHASLAANGSATLPSLPSAGPNTIPKTNNATNPNNATANANDTRISPSNPMESPDLLHALASNCTDHSYTGCTRCLATLRKEVSSKVARSLGVTRSSKTTLDCELIGLMWLLDLNKSFYIPTVSAVVRALMYNGHADMYSAEGPGPTCSPDVENMPLALDYLEVLSQTDGRSTKSSRARQASGTPSLPLLLSLLALVVAIPSLNPRRLGTFVG